MVAVARSCLFLLLIVIPNTSSAAIVGAGDFVNIGASYVNGTAPLDRGEKDSFVHATKYLAENSAGYQLYTIPSPMGILAPALNWTYPYTYFGQSFPDNSPVSSLTDQLGSVGVFLPADGTNADKFAVFSPLSVVGDGFNTYTYASESTDQDNNSVVDGLWKGTIEDTGTEARGFRVVFDDLQSKISVFLIASGTGDPTVQLLAYGEDSSNPIGSMTIHLTDSDEHELTFEQTQSTIKYFEVFNAPYTGEAKPYYITGFSFGTLDEEIVPEPATLISWSILSFCGLLGYRRRRASSAQAA